jgi:methionyl-tRNA formyltransferase
MNIIFFGTPEFVTPVITQLCKEHTVITLVTTPDQKVGRQQVVTASPVKQYGQEHNIPVLTPHALDIRVTEELSLLQPDVIIVASYGKIIPQSVLDVPKYGAINIHPSLLPKFRGASPIPATILSGDTVGGISVIKMDAELDHGPIIAQEEYILNPTDTTQILLPILFEKGIQILLKNLDAYISGTPPVPQNHAHATFCGRFTKEDAFIDMNNLPNKEMLDRMIRAYTPWPIVWSIVTIKNQELRIKLFPGNIVQLEGRNKMPVTELLKGIPELEGTLHTILDF